MSLISATLTKEAQEIYDSWPRMSKENGYISKSAKISLLIVSGDSLRVRVNDLTQGINERYKAISRVIWELKSNPIHRLLRDDLNDLLIGTIMYQYRNPEK